MIPTRTAVILLSLLLASTLAEENPDPIFKALGEDMEMGFCFGGGIAVYRLTSKGKELLGQASTSLVSDAFEGRIKISDGIKGLLGLRISNLQFSDSGVYIRECWSGDSVDNYEKHALYVCNKEMASQKIVLSPRTGADLVCNLDSRKNATIKWYRGVHNASLFIDTSISLEPLQKEFKSLIQVNDEGSSLHVSDSFIKDRPYFICVVMEGQQCKSFQRIGLSEEPEATTVYRSVGEDIFLRCSADRLREKHWITPVGQLNSSTPVYFKGTTMNQIYVSTSVNSEEYSLNIHSLAEEHSGSYKCFSTFLVEEYIVNVCPLLELTYLTFSAESKKELLQCDFMNSSAVMDKVGSASVQWYRKFGENDILLLDSGDPTITPPEDLKDRLTFSKVDSSLVFTDPKEKDSGTYWCVVLLDNDYHDEVDDDYTAYPSDDVGVDEEDYDDEEGEEEEELHALIMEEDYMDMCLFRQVTNVKFIGGKNKHETRILKTDSKSQPVPTAQTENKSQPVPTAQPEPETNLTIYAICVGIGALVLFSLIGVVVALKRRVKKSTTSAQGRGLELSEEAKSLKSNVTV